MGLSEKYLSVSVCFFNKAEKVVFFLMEGEMVHSFGLVPHQCPTDINMQ